MLFSLLANPAPKLQPPRRPSSTHEKTAQQGREVVADVPSSFEELYEQQYAFVRRTVRRFGVSDAALEDVCQEVFVVIYRRFGEFEGRAKLTTWIYRIVALTAQNHLRGLRRKPAQPLPPNEELGQLPTAAVDPELHLGREQAARIARGIVMNMSESRRMAFVLVELEGMTYAQAAEALEETQATVRARVRAARDEFTRHARRFEHLESGVQHG